MESIYVERGVNVVTLGNNYDSLDEEATRRLELTLRELSQSATPPLIVVDMSQTDGIGSTFLAILFSTERRLRDRQGHLALCGVSSFCSEVLQIVKAEHMFKVFASRDEAITQLLAAS